MSSTSAIAEIDRPAMGSSVDGRHLRSERSRKAIVAALMKLIRAGETMPSAERVSEEANVGLRTVFRHFDDMDRLYQEVGEQIEAEVNPMKCAPFTSTDWRSQLFEMIDRRAEVFEWIMPFKILADARKLQSQYIQDKQRIAVEADHQMILSVLPPSVRQDETLTAALSAGMSFDVWIRLRKDQNRTPEQAFQAMRRIAEALIGGR